MQYSVVRTHHGQLKLPDEAQIRRPLEATWISYLQYAIYAYFVCYYAYWLKEIGKTLPYNSERYKLREGS